MIKFAAKHCYLYEYAINNYSVFSVQRVAPAAADLNRVLYVSGGYDGKNYLRLENCNSAYMFPFLFY